MEPLGLRTPSGGPFRPATWEVVRLDAGAVVWESASDDLDDHVVLNATIPCKATIRFT